MTVRLFSRVPLAARASTGVKPILASTMWTRSAKRALPGTTTYESRVDLVLAGVSLASVAGPPSNTKCIGIDLPLNSEKQ